MDHPARLTHRLAALTAGLAVCLVGQVVTAPEPFAAPAPAAPAAAGVPDSYTPPAGALFNRPTGTRAQQYRLFTHINRTINSTPSGSAIRIAVFSFSDGRTADNLIRAHRRGVDVRLVFDGHRVFDAQRRLVRALGSDPRRRSFAILCDNACRSRGGEMHSKVFLFGRAGRAQKVVMVGSNNMTSHNAERQWSDLVTMRNNKAIYRPFRVWFEQAKWDRPLADPRIAVASGQKLALMLPQEPATYGDPALTALAPVQCPAAPEQPTQVLISAHAWYGPRGQAIANRVGRLAEEGCRVKVFYGEAFGSEIEKTLRRSGAVLRTSRHRGIKTHQKLLVVRGRYGGNHDAGFVWTGSHNWSPGALRIDDVIVRISRPAVVESYQRHFRYMFRNA